MAYVIEFQPSARKHLEALPRRVQLRIGRAIANLREDPFSRSPKLSGEPEIWRARVGDYRVLYKIERERQVIVVLTVGHRRDVYRWLRSL
jgi:mRNA interferase RelE/StbE